MGKNSKQRFNKKQSVRFTLVPGFDQNGKPITLYRPVDQMKSKVTSGQRQKLIKQISDEQYDQIQINGKKVNQNQIPAFVLEQIRGRKDLVWNQKQEEKEEKMGYEEKGQGDLYQVMDVEEYSDYDDDGKEEWIDQEEIIDEDDGEYTDEDQYTDEQDYQQIQQQQSQQKPFKLNEQQFPTLNKVNIDGKQYQLTQQQIKLLDVLLPQNYQTFQLKGLKFQKYGQDGLPLSKKDQYEQWLATGKQGVVDTYVFVPQKPTNIYDNDLKPSQIKGELKEIEDALNFSGEEEAYEEMEDDFFAKMVKNQIEVNKKQQKVGKKSKKQNKEKKEKKTVGTNIKPSPKQLKQTVLPKILTQNNSKSQNIFSKYDQLDQQDLNQQLTDQMLQKALDDFENNLQPNIKNTKLKHQIQQQHLQQQQQYGSRSNNISMNYSQIQQREQYMGKDGQLDWRCLSKKQKKQYMKTKIIRDFYDEVRERQIQDKLRGKKNVTAEELHLKTMVKHLTYQEDHVMRRALQNDAKEEVKFDQESDYETSSEGEDIVEYRQRTSVISSSLNQISQPAKKKKRKVKNQDGEQVSQLDQLSATISQMKIVPEKRNRKQTSQQRKERKEKLKQMKKNKKELKKQFAQKFGEERRKAMKMTKHTDPLHKVAYVKII